MLNEAYRADYDAHIDSVTFDVAYLYIKITRKIAWKMISHAKRIERWNVKQVHAYIVAEGVK